MVMKRIFRSSNKRLENSAKRGSHLRFTVHQILFGYINVMRTCWMMDTWEIRETITKFCSKNLKGRRHLRDQGVTVRMILKCILNVAGTIDSI